MSRFVGQIVKLEQRSLQSDAWANHAEAWAEILRRYATAHGGHMDDGEVKSAGMVLAAGSPLHALADLAHTYRKGGM